MKLFRWRGIIPLVLGLGLAALWWALFAEHAVKTTLEEAGTKALGTELDIARLRVLVPRSAVELHEIAVADPFDSGRNLVEAKLVRVELDPEALLERKLVIRGLTIGDVRTGTHRLTRARPVAGGGFAPRALLELQRWAKQFDVPLLSLTPIDTVKALVLDPRQLRSVQSALMLAQRADSVRTALSGGYASLGIPETLDSAQALVTRLQRTNVRTLGITGTRAAISDLRRTVARVDSTRARVQALQATLRTALDSLQHGVNALDDARREDYAFARGLLQLPTVDAPNIGAALFGKVTIDKVQQALYWTDLARQYAPPGLLPREEPGPKRLRMAGSTIHFVKQRSYPRFLLQRGDVDLTVSDGPARGRYTLAIADATTEPALVGRPMRFALRRAATGSALDWLRVVGAIDHTQSRSREVLTVNAAGLALPGIPFPSLPYRLEPGRGTSTLQLSLDGDQLSARWTMSSTDVAWIPDSTRARRLGTVESMVAQVLVGIHRVDLAAEMHGPARSPAMSVRSNLDQAIADRLRAVAGEQIASAEAKMRAQVDRIVDEKTAPVKARVAAVRAEAEQRVAEARKQLDAEKGRLDERLTALAHMPFSSSLLPHSSAVPCMDLARRTVEPDHVARPERGAAMERERFDDETGASTGDLRENDPRAPGFTDDDDRLFRSHFQHANRIADRSYEQVRPAYRLGFEAASDARYTGHSFDEIERDLEGGWLNERTARGDWQSVRDYARLAFERGRALGYISSAEFLAGTSSHQRASFSDPVPANIDPTAPESPEQTLDYQRVNNRGPEWRVQEVGATGLEAPGDVRESPMGSTGEEMVHPPEEPGNEGGGARQ